MSYRSRHNLAGWRRWRRARRKLPIHIINGRRYRVVPVNQWTALPAKPGDY